MEVNFALVSRIRSKRIWQTFNKVSIQNSTGNNDFGKDIMKKREKTQEAHESGDLEEMGKSNSA